MFFKRKQAVETLEFNHAYEDFQNNMNIILLCVDDDLKFDVRHPVDAQCYPSRLIDQHAGSLTVVSIFSLTKSLKTLIISMRLSFFIVKFVKFNVGICRNV